MKFDWLNWERAVVVLAFVLVYLMATDTTLFGDTHEPPIDTDRVSDPRIVYVVFGNREVPCAVVDLGSRMGGMSCNWNQETETS